FVLTSSCYSLTDPHILIFDGRPFENHHRGKFVLYKSMRRMVFVSVVYVRADMSEWGVSVTVRAPSRDFSHTRGLCGTIDRNIHNIFQGPNGTMYHHGNLDLFIHIWSYKACASSITHITLNTLGAAGERHLLSNSRKGPDTAPVGEQMPWLSISRSQRSLTWDLEEPDSLVQYISSIDMEYFVYCFQYDHLSSADHSYLVLNGPVACRHLKL
ncbi:von Willebrand factor D and EGF domain-containing protein isoform X1, partial [Tachysurus ichikawai]